MADEDPEPPRRTRIQGIAAGAIRFDSAGRILVSPEVQAEAGGFKLPDWLPGGGGPGGDDGGGTVLACPNPACGAVAACAPLTACVNPECEGVVGCGELTACMNPECEGVVGCGDLNPQCEVMGCADVNCDADVVACDDTACSDLFCRENEACKNDGCEINLGCGEGGPEAPETETPQL